MPTAFRPTDWFKQFRRRLYITFIEPKQLEQSTRNRELVFNVVLAGTGGFMLALLILLLYSFIFWENHYIFGRVLVAASGVTAMFVLRWLSRRRGYYTAAYWLVGFYGLLAIGSVAAWGISTPFGISLLGLVIILASTLLGSKHALYAALVASASVIIIQIANEAGWLVSQPTGPHVKTGIGDAIGESIVFSILAIISWLFGRGMEHSLLRAETAEAELEVEKAGLEQRVGERTAQLQQSQVEEVRQLYHFAEVGQLSTALLHDLANYLTLLTLEIGSIKGRGNNETLARSREAIAQLNEMLEEVRDRLAKGPVKKQYNLVSIINEAVVALQYKRSPVLVQISWDPPAQKQAFAFYGDPIKCSQIITILLSNAIDAYAEKRLKPNEIPEVIVRLRQEDGKVRVSVSDWGVGIKPAIRPKVFQLDFGTKRHGMGIGLYLAKQMVTTEFNGDLMLVPADDRTEFIIELPMAQKHNGKRSDR